MNNPTKGQITRNMILEKARTIFNEKGLDLTLDALVREMDQTKGRITNHFSTKELLFQAIMDFYEWQLGEYVRHFKWQERQLDLTSLSIFISGIMDIQYENRCAIGYLAMVTRGKADVFQHIQHTYKRNVASIRSRLTDMVKLGLLEPIILQNRVFPVFQFQYTSLLTNWVISAQHYGAEIGYHSLKPIYLQGILQCYFPYLSPEGLDQFKKLNFSKLAKMS